MPKNYSGFFLAFTALMALTGCGVKNPLNRQAVSGMITIDSQPVEHGSIEFNPMDPKGIMSGAGITNGRYLVPVEKGLPPGEYLIRIYAPGEKMVTIEEAPGEMTRAAKELIPAKYNTKSNEKRTVEAGKVNEFDFDIPKAAVK